MTDELHMLAERLAEKWARGGQVGRVEVIEQLVGWVGSRQTLVIGIVAGMLDREGDPAPFRDWMRDVVDPTMLATGGQPYSLPPENEV
jgi:hypothetical protein